MKLTRILLGALTVFVSSPALARIYQYGWTLSSSATNPYVNTAIVPGSQDFPLYLWMDCSSGDGWSAAELSIQNLASNFVMMSYTPMSGVINVGTFPDNMQLAVGGCPTGPTLVGRINSFALGPVTGEICIAPSSGGNRVTHDCALPPAAHPLLARGFGFGANASCDDAPDRQLLCLTIENPPGACCMPDGTCEINSLQGCAAAGGIFQGYYQSCSTAECEPISTDTATWGRTKADYRE